MEKIRIWFSDFSSDVKIEDHYLFKLLNEKFDIEIDDKQPQYLISSCYSSSFLKYDCIRIFYTAENVHPDFNLFDYAIGFDYIEFGNRYLRFPNYAIYGEDLKKSLVYEKEVSFAKKDYFCNFIYTNSFADPRRDLFFNLLSKYKFIHSIGNHLNNCDLRIDGRYSQDWRTSKIGLQKKFKFTIAFENSSTPGYTTEKIFHAFLANTIPIYWGNPLVAKEFNPKSFINCHDYKSFDEVIEAVKEIDKNEILYEKMLNEPCFHENKIPGSIGDKYLLNFFEDIFNQPIEQARKRPQYGWIPYYERNLKKIYKFYKFKRYFTFPFLLIRKFFGK